MDIGIGAVDGGIEGTGYFVDAFITFRLGLAVEGGAPTMLRYPSPFDAAGGSLGDLRARGGFAGAVCVGTFVTSIGTDPLPDPAPGEGRYYLARGLEACTAQGYGDSSVTPDPRDALDADPPCP